MGVFSKTIISLTLVGYKMIVANAALRALLAISTISTRNRGIIVN